MDKKNNLGSEPAFPTDNYEYNASFIGEMSGKEIKTTFFKSVPGMSKRFYAACAAMQGLLTDKVSEHILTDRVMLINIAYEYADELIRQEVESCG